MLQCTCSNVAVLFARPPSLLDHMINQSGSDLIRDNGPRPHPLTLTPLALPLFVMLASIAPKQKSSPVALLC